MPSRFLYLKLNLQEDIIGGIFRDNVLRINYMNTKTIYDRNEREIKASTYGTVLIKADQYFSE
jgi:hypothetical protein